MLSNLFTRRAFAGRLATLFPGLGFAAALPTSAAAKSREGEVKKLNWDGKPADPNSFITPRHRSRRRDLHCRPGRAFA